MAQKNRRILAASVVGLFAFAAVSVAIGATEGAQANDMPQSFGLIAPMQGDYANYTMTLGEGFRFGPYVDEDLPTWYAFGWTEPEALRDAHGSMAMTDVLSTSGWNYYHAGYPVYYYDEGEAREEREYWSYEPANYYFRGGAQELVGYGYRETDSASGGVVINGLALPSIMGGDWNVEVTAYDKPELMHCMAQNPLQGAAAAPVALPMGRPCTMDPIPFTAEATDVLVPIGLESLDGNVAMRYELLPAQESAELELPQTRLDVWYVPGSPYPVKAEVTAAYVATDMFADGAGNLTFELLTTTLDLDRFSRGGKTLLTNDEVLRDPAPALEFADRQPWGLDETGFDHAFPVSAAFKIALDDADSGLAKFMTQHPEAFVYTAQYFVLARNDADEHNWWFLVGDHEESLEYTVTRTQKSVSSLLPPVILGDRIDGGWESNRVAPENIPTQMPTVGSLWNRWQAYANDGLSREGFGWSISEVYDAECLCFTPGVKGDILLVDLRNVNADNIGEAELDFANIALGTIEFTNQERAAIHLYLGLDAHYGLAAMEGERRDEPGFFAVGTVNSGFWEWPTPIQAAGAGFFAALMAILYLAWPALKSAPLLGLFSRVHGEQVLEHPKRQAIHEAVRSAPGIHFQELRRRTGLPNGSAVHHLRTMMRTGHVHERREGGFTCYYPDRSQLRPGTRPIRSETARDILKLLQAEPGIAGKDIAAALGIAPATVSYHLRKLRELGY